MLKLSGVVEFNAGLDRWLSDVDELADGVMRGLAIRAFEFVVQGTAQWSGNLAGSWSLSVGAPVAVAQTLLKDLEPPSTGPLAQSDLRRGSPRGVEYARARARADGAAGRIDVSRSVWIATGVPYAVAVQDDKHPATGRAFLRPVNLPVEMVMQAAEHPSIGGIGHISEATARALASLQV